MKKKSFFRRVLAFLLAVLMICGTSWGSSDFSVVNATGIENDGSGQDPEGGNSEPTGEENPVYSVIVTQPDGVVFYPGTTGAAFTAEVTKDGEPVSDALVEWSCTEDVATVSADGKLDISEEAAAGTEITVTAIYTIPEGGEVSGSAEVLVAAPEEVRVPVSGTVKDSFDQKILTGAYITLTPSPGGASLSATTGEDGTFQVELVQGQSYDLTVEKEGYHTYGPIAVTSESWQNEILLNIDGSLTITGSNTLLVTQEEPIRLSAEITGNLGAVEWSVEPAGIVSITPEGEENRTLTVVPVQEGDVIITASAHGVDATFPIQVTRDTVEGSLAIYRGDTELYSEGDSSEELYANPSDALTFYIGFTSVSSTEALESGRVLWKLTSPDGDSITGTEEITDISASAIPGYAYAAVIQADYEGKGLPQAGTYTLEYQFEGNNQYSASANYSRTFEAKGKSGQAIEVASNQFDNVIYGDEVHTFQFTAQVHGDLDQVTNLQNWNGTANWSGADWLDANANLVQVTNVALESGANSPDENGLYSVTGTAQFYASQSTENATITISYHHTNDNNIQVYQDATGTVIFRIQPKTLTVAGVTYAVGPRIYDGTDDADAEAITLQGIVGEDSVAANPDGLHFDRADVGDAYLDTKKQSIQLTGDDSANYTLNQESAETFKREIQPRTISVIIPEIIEIGYYDARLNSNTGSGELNTYIIDQIGENNIFDNFVEADLSNMEELLSAIEESYMPGFKVIETLEGQKEQPINQSTGTGTYTIVALEPTTEKPAVLKNYQFDFSGKENREVGTLRIVEASVERNVHYTLQGDYVYVAPDAEGNAQEGTVWVMPNTELKIVPDGTIYTEAEPNTVTVSEEDGNVQFVLKKGNTVSQSQTEKYQIDGTVPSVTITISELASGEKSFLEQFWDAVTFGVFAKPQSKISLTYSDNQSGVKSVSYVLVNTSDCPETIDSDFLSRLTWQEYPEEGVTFAAESKVIVCARVEDQVGNIRYATSDGVVVDNTAPDGVSLTIQNPEDGQNGIYSTDVEVKVEVADTTLITSGIDSITAEVYVNGGTEPIVNAVEGGYTGEAGGRTEEQLAADSQVGTVFTVSADACNVLTEPGDSNAVEVKVTVTDRSGNQTVKSISFTIDQNAPQVDVKLDPEEPVQTYNGVHYFASQRTATITVTEASFDASKVTFLLNDAQYVDSDGWAHNGSVHTITYTFDTDGDYTFDVQMEDMAGNTSAMGNNVPGHYRAFTLDLTDPEVVGVQYYMYEEGNRWEITPAKAEAERFFGDGQIYAEITLREHNFVGLDAGAAEESGLSLSIDARNTGDGYTAPAYRWVSSNGDDHTLLVEYNGDANYVFDMQYTDLAKRTLSQDYAPDYFTVDTAAPNAASLRVSSFDNVWSQFLNTITFGLFSNQSQTVTIYGESDVTSGVQTVQYYKSHDSMTTNQLDALAASAWVNGRSLTVDANQRCVVYAKITDRSGNYAYFSTDGFIVDDQIGLPEIRIVTPEPLNHIYNGNVDVQITVVDPDPAGNLDYSGLRSVYYEVRNQGTVTQSGNLPFTAGAQTMTGTVTVDSSRNNSNDVQVYVRAEDRAGNVSEQTLPQAIAIDITAPEISVSFDNNAPLNGQYYRETRTATVTIRERNFDPSNVQIRVSNTDGTQPTITGWSSSANAGVSDDATHTCQIIFSADGDYNFTVDCTDLALNRAANPYQSETFTIDKTVPTVSVSYNNNAASNGRYYREGRTATITITEHNFNASAVRVTTTASLNGTSISAPSVSGWSNNGDRHTATVRFTADGDYTLDVAYTDQAGNPMADYDADSFTVDLTNPEVVISGVEDRSANRGTVAPVIRISDNNYTADGVTLTLTGVNRGRVDVDSMVSRSTSENGQVITFRNFGSGMDDIYTLTARSADQAGNETSRSITFSVNRDGSTYELGEYTQQLIDTGFTNQPQDLVIREINVDTLEFRELTYSKDGQVVTLQEGVDYTLEVEGGEGQWKVYTYTIKASCFEEEGEYTLNIYSEDRASNTSTNQVKAKNIEFVVDKTAPSISVANLENRGRYSENTHTFTLSVKDNTRLSYVELYLDGQLVHTYGEEELQVVDGTLTIMVDSKDAYQDVRIIAYDAAGNPTEPLDYQVLVTSNGWIQFYMNKPLFFGSIAGVVVVAGLIIFFIVKRRKKEEQA